MSWFSCEHGSSFPPAAGVPSPLRSAHLPIYPNFSPFHRSNLIPLCIQYPLLLECTFSFSSIHLCICPSKLLWETPGKVKTWPRFHFAINKEKSLMIPAYGEGVGNRYLMLLLEYKIVLHLWREVYVVYRLKLKDTYPCTQQSHLLRMKPTEKFVQVGKVFVK